MNPKNLKLYNCNGEYYIKDQYRKDTYFDYEDAYNYYDIDVDKTLLIKQIDNEYFIRYSDLCKVEIVPLQLKIKNGELHTFTKNDRVLLIKNDGKELFKKIREIWNKIIKLIGTDNTSDFVKTTLVDGIEFIEVDVLENMVFTEDIYDDQLVIVLHSVFNDYLQTMQILIISISIQ